MYDVRAAHARIAAAGAELIRKIGGELDSLTESVDGRETVVMRTELAQRLQFAVELAVLRERLEQLLPGARMGWKSDRIAEAAAEFLEAVSKSAGRSNEQAKIAYSRGEAARVLSVSVPTVDRLIARGLLHPSRATRRPMFTVAELERYMRETSEQIGP